MLSHHVSKLGADTSMQPVNDFPFVSIEKFQIDCFNNASFFSCDVM